MLGQLSELRDLLLPVNPFGAPSSVRTAASDYYLRHPELSAVHGNAASDFSLGNPKWTWAVAPSAVTIVTSDYYEHHPELRNK
jgi:hypothetical protein